MSHRHLPDDTPRNSVDAAAGPMLADRFTGLSIAMFFGIFVLVFSAMMAPIPAVQHTYAAFFRSVGNLVFAEPGDEARCSFVALNRPDGRMDTEIQLTNLRTTTTAKMNTSSRFTGYVPTAIVLALILASPIRLKQKAWAFVWGLLACQVYLVLRIGTGVLRRFTMSDDLAIWTPGPIANFLIEAMFDIFVVSAIGGFILPILIWVLVTFRRHDWYRLQNTGGASFRRFVPRRPPTPTTMT